MKKLTSAVIWITITLGVLTLIVALVMIICWLVSGAPRITSIDLSSTSSSFLAESTSNQPARFIVSKRAGFRFGLTEIVGHA